MLLNRDGGQNLSFNSLIPIAAAEVPLMDLIFLNTSVIKQISIAHFLVWLFA